MKYFGNIKFCSEVNGVNSDSDSQINLNSKKVWCAVSTHSGEEIFCANVHRIIKKKHDKIITIIIPRHISRTKKIFLDLKKMGLNVQIKNENQNVDQNSDIVLINYYGSVKKYLKKFDQIFIGKSLLKKRERDSGQNPIDAAKMGCYVFHGPYVSNFQEIYDYLDSEKLSEKINNPNVLAEKLIENFQIDQKRKTEKQDKLNNYSSEIFKSVIKEYENFIK